MHSIHQAERDTSQTELKQAPMADYKKPTSSLLNSNRLFTNFIPKSFNDSESIMSPTSILDFKSLKTPPNQEIKNLWGPRGPSLGLIEALTDDTPGPNSTRPGSRTVLFGPQLKIQVPPLPLSPSESPKSPSDFGTKTAQSHTGPLSPPNLRKPPPNSGRLSPTEMELSEDYTRVISYGPNPKTTHIFDDCIVDSCCGVVKFSESRKDPSAGDRYPSDSFLSCCCRCSKNLQQGECDIYMYRGEKAFCSVECRCEEMTMEDEWMDI